MNKHVWVVFIVTAIIVASSFAIYFCQYRPKHEFRGFPYSLTKSDVEYLKEKSIRGDCEASTRLAMYYLYGALELDTATKFLRIAAKCPDNAPKEYLVHILMHNKDDSETTAEIHQLIDEIRKTDPAKATELEGQLNENNR